jgi:rod shape-determining protein MreC
VLDKGTGQGLYNGQPVIDAYGVMGQVIEAGPLTSRAMLITDPAHAIPVQVTRNGLRTIVFGTGQADRVAVRYLTSISDIKVGDLLVTSGMGGTFPANYPVAQVVRIVNNPNESFLDIEAQPVARLNHNREALLIWPGSKLVPTALPTEKPKPAPTKPAAPKPAPVAKPAAPIPAAPTVAPAAPVPAPATPPPTSTP